jgi:hypothetical protein
VLLAAVRAELIAPRHLLTRRHRSYPRVVKRARHNSYKVKRLGDTGTRHASPPTIYLPNLKPLIHPAQPAPARPPNLQLAA